GTRAYAAVGNTIIVALDLTSNSPIAVFPTPGFGIQGLALSPDGTQLYVGLDIGISVINIASGFIPITFALPATPVRGLTFIPDGTRVYAANGSGTASAVSVVQVIR